MSHRHILIGTAGHIDHGKTSLVRRLTGINTDRLPEEKSRGISIDLGFAHWESGGFEFGIVDVPGHERFVRNMVAGATGINLALLVVAADDGVMPQTREHLDVMELLGVPAGLVVITKTDLVEPGLVELVRAEIDELTAGTFLSQAPVVPVSAATGEGFDRLEQTLVKLAESVVWPETMPLFRMPIDRVFTLAGHGTVVTGSVQTGEVRAGDTLELLPAQRPVRVRGVQSHGRCGDSGPRRRTGLNLAGVKTDDVRRGDELATPGYLLPTRRLVVELRSLPSGGIVKHRSKQMLHLGTREVECRVILRDGPLEPGGKRFAELRLAEPVVAGWGQRFILRRTSPALTIAGGTVLDPSLAPRRRIRDLDALGKALRSSSEEERLGVLLRHHEAIDGGEADAVRSGAHSLLVLEAARRAGIPPARVAPAIASLEQRGDLVRVGAEGSRLLLHHTRRDELLAATTRALRQELDRRQPRRTLPRIVAAAACRGISPPRVLDALLDELVRTGELVESAGGLGPADRQVKLTKNQQAARARLLESITQAGLTPPLTRELAASLKLPEKDLAPLITLCVEDGQLVPVDDTMLVTPESLARARAIVERVFAERTHATMSELREAWGVTRKYSLPLCAYFDALGVTIREGDARRPGPNLRTAAPNGPIP